MPAEVRAAADIGPNSSTAMRRGGSRPISPAAGVVAEGLIAELSGCLRCHSCELCLCVDRVVPRVSGRRANLPAPWRVRITCVASRDCRRSGCYYSVQYQQCCHQSNHWSCSSFWSADAVRARADTSTLVDAALGLASLAGDRGRNI
jgi:hypothetical protein